MPRENKKRGRRAEARKRQLEEQHDDEDEAPASSNKKRRLSNESDILDDELRPYHGPTRQNGEHDAYHGDHEVDQNQPEAKPFYGLLDDSEQEYFRRADDMLEVNQFAGPEERSLFLENVYKEADGKELKMACSQSCSRLLERLILLSTPDQLKILFSKFTGNFLNLVQHRFASHCCEALFLQAAPSVSQELLSPIADNPKDLSKGERLDMMEDLFLSAAADLEGNLGYLLTNKFASHTIRVLLLVLSGQPLDSRSSESALKSKSKENVTVAGVGQATDLMLEARSVPNSFKEAMQKIIYQSVAGLDTHYIRSLATHKVGNPMLQLLLRLESQHFGKQQAKNADSIIRRLLPDTLITEDTESARFINGIVYDPIGSHLVESIVQHSHGKIFKSLFGGLFRDRIGSLARNEIASYVAARILERLGHDELLAATEKIVLQIPNLAERGRTAIIRTLIERCDARGVDTAIIANALRDVYSDDKGVTFSLPKLLGLNPEVTLAIDTNGLSGSEFGNQSSTKSRSKALLPNSQTPTVSNAGVTHASLLAQAMLQSTGPLSTMMFTAISALPQDMCLYIVVTSNLSQVLQTALVVPHAPLIFRRKLIIRFYSHIGNLSLDPSGSHFIDAIWQGTQGLAFVRERIAEELAENEGQLRESPCGRKVWRNWRMDLYRRRRGEWVRLTRESAGNHGFLSFPGGESDASSKYAGHHTNGSRHPRPGPTFSIPHLKQTQTPGKEALTPDASNTSHKQGKTKLDLARERFARSSKLIP